MKNKLNKYLLFVLIFFVTLSASANICSKENKSPQGDTVTLLHKFQKIKFQNFQILELQNLHVPKHKYIQIPKFIESKKSKTDKFPCILKLPIKLLRYAIKLSKYTQPPSAKNAFIQLLWIIAWIIYIIPLLVVIFVMITAAIIYLIAIIALLGAIIFGLIIGILLLLGVSLGFWAFFFAILGGLIFGSLIYLLIIGLCP